MLHALFNKPRKYPRIYQPYGDQFNFYEGREKWLESIQSAPREAVLLYSLHWLHLEVYNGGFWQYFYNSTGTSFPEASEGFTKIGMKDVANVVDRAAAKLGTPFPFDIDRRRELVGPPQNRMNFEELETAFYSLADTDKYFRRLPKFVPFAEQFADAFDNAREN